MERKILRDLLPTVVKHGDVRGLLSLLFKSSRLRNEESDNPELFWYKHFKMFYPQYISEFSQHKVRSWKSLMLWIAWAEKKIVQYITNRLPNDLLFDITTWEIIVLETKKHYTLRDFAYMFGFKNGRLLSLGNATDNSSLSTRALHDYFLGHLIYFDEDFMSSDDDIVISTSQRLLNNVRERSDINILMSLLERFTLPDHKKKKWRHSDWNETRYPQKDGMVFLGNKIK